MVVHSDDTRNKQRDSHRIDKFPGHLAQMLFRFGISFAHFDLLDHRRVKRVGDQKRDG